MVPLLLELVLGLRNVTNMSSQKLTPINDALTYRQGSHLPHFQHLQTKIPVSTTKHLNEAPQLSLNFVNNAKQNAQFHRHDTTTQGLRTLLSRSSCTCAFSGGTTVMVAGADCCANIDCVDGDADDDVVMAVAVSSRAGCGNSGGGGETREGRAERGSASDGGFSVSTVGITAGAGAVSGAVGEPGAVVSGELNFDSAAARDGSTTKAHKLSR